MSFLAFFLVAVVAIEHIYILVLEMFFSTSKTAETTFGVPASVLKQPEVKIMMGNQGLYNGFLAAGLLWGLFFAAPEQAFSVKVFFLGCVIVAAIYGGLTANKGIILKQGLPAMLALLVVLLTN